MSEKAISPWEYLWFALYSFAVLGAELILLGFLEPAVLGRPSSEYTDAQRIIHWLLTAAVWSALSALLFRAARRRGLLPDVPAGRPGPGHAVLCAALAVFCIALNAHGWGTLKIIGEWQSKTPLTFFCQYAYYMAEMLPVLLIVIFGQQFGERLSSRSAGFPWGGLVLALTWGAVHALTRGSPGAGLSGALFSLAAGGMYLALRRHAVPSFLAMTAAFII